MPPDDHEHAPIELYTLTSDQSKEEEFANVSEACTNIIRILATTVHWFKATTYSLSTRRLRVKFAHTEHG